MNRPLSLLLPLLCLGLSPALCADPLLAPVPPGTMLAALPSVPAEWHCVQSQARTEVSVTDVPETVAIRRYDLPDPGGGTGTAGSLRLVAIDAGSRDAVARDVAVRVQAAASGNSADERLSLPGADGVLVERPPGRFLFEAAAGKRFVLTVEGRLAGHDRERFKALLKGLDFSAWAAAATAAPARPLSGTTFEVSVLDELNPAANRTSTVTVVTMDQLRRGE